jgi:hypothetical protein
MQIELHGRTCSCRGGSWVIVAEGGSPCAGQSGDQPRIVLSFTEWKNLGKPGSIEEHEQAHAREQEGERREFHRYAVEIKVRLARLPSWRKEETQAEETVTDVVAKGGALVRSRMAVEKGEVLQFEILPSFRTKAEVMYVSGGQGSLRLGLRFLDGLLPDGLIPAGATPLP